MRLRAFFISLFGVSSLFFLKACTSKNRLSGSRCTKIRNRLGRSSPNQGVYSGSLIKWGYCKTGHSEASSSQLSKYCASRAVASFSRKSATGCRPRLSSYKINSRIASAKLAPLCCRQTSLLLSCCRSLHLRGVLLRYLPDSTRLARMRNAPGTPAGSSRNNDKPV